MEENIWKKVEDNKLFEYIKTQEKVSKIKSILIALFCIVFIFIIALLITYVIYSDSLSSTETDIRVWGTSDMAGFFTGESSYEVKQIMADYDGTDEYKEQVIKKIEDKYTKKYYTILTIEIIIFLLIILIVVRGYKKTCMSFGQIDNLLVAYCTCIGKERIRGRYESSDTVDVQLIDDQKLKKLEVSSNTYDNIELGEKLLLVKLRDSYAEVDGVFLVPNL